MRLELSVTPLEKYLDLVPNGTSQFQCFWSRLAPHGEYLCVGYKTQRCSTRIRSYVERVALTDIYADGIADVELLGDNVRLIYFTWERGQKYCVGTRVRSGRLPVVVLQHG